MEQRCLDPKHIRECVWAGEGSGFDCTKSACIATKRRACHNKSDDITGRHRALFGLMFRRFSYAHEKRGKHNHQSRTQKYSLAEIIEH